MACFRAGPSQVGPKAGSQLRVKMTPSGQRCACLWVCKSGPAGRPLPGGKRRRTPQIAHRGYWVPLAHPVYGEVPYSGLAHIMSRTPGVVHSPAPCVGQHSWQILEDILGFDGDTIAQLLVENVVEITG